MSETNLGKLFEAGALLAGLGLFVWWQLRDLRRAKADSKKAKEASEAESKKPDGGGAP